MNFELDQFQRDILAAEGNIVLCSGRQVGKSTVIAIKAGEYAVRNRKKTIMVIAFVERQALLLFEKILSYVMEKYPKQIKTGKDRPTKHKLMLKNGSVIHCLPTGASGYGIRGFTIDQLYIDECAFVPEEVFAAVTPALATTGGEIIALSTPFGREGYFFRCFSDETFTKFNISTEEVAESRPEPQKARMKEFLIREKSRMTTRQYAQEYLGQFVSDLNQFYPDKLISDCMTLTRKESISPRSTYYLGVDLAAMGEDESVFSVFEKIDDTLNHVENIITRKTLLTMSTRLIIKLDKQYDFRRIYLDTGGIGVGVFHQLLEEEQTRRKVEAVDNLRRAMDREANRNKKLLKEDLYNNLLMLMETGKIKFLDDPEIYQSLKSVQYEYTGGQFEEKQLKIHGNYTHCAESIIRAAWALHDKGGSVWIR